MRTNVLKEKNPKSTLSNYLLSVQEYIDQGSNILELWRKEKDSFAKELMNMNFKQVEAHSTQLINILESFVSLFLFRNPKGRPTPGERKYVDFRVHRLIHNPTISLYKQIQRIKAAVRDLDLKLYINEINEASKRMDLILENAEHIMDNGLDCPKKPTWTALPKKITKILKQLHEYEKGGQSVD